MNKTCAFQESLETMELKEAGGKTLPAIAVFTLSIKALKDHLLDMLDTRGTTLQAEEVLWVLTVPAIWTDSAKFFMRKAALGVIFLHIFNFNFFSLSFIYVLVLYI